MSETDLQNKTTPSQPEIPPEPAPAPRRAGSPLAGLALLVALAALGTAGWTAWQDYRQQGALIAREAAASSQLNEGRAQLDSVTQRLDARLASLPEASQIDAQRQLLGNLQRDQQQLAGKLDKVLGASREDWRLAEAEHLVRLAMLRLSAMQDIASAQALLRGADGILKAQHDPLAFAARQALIDAQERLRAQPAPDREGLYLQLAALQQQVAELQALNPDYHPAAEDDPQPSQTSRWRRWWDKLSGYLRIDLYADQDIRPLLDGQRLAQVRLTLSLALEQAQWAALQGRAEVYATALEQAGGLLDDYFSAENREVATLHQRLDELAQQPVAVQMPDLQPALEALQAYLARRQGDAGEAPAAEEGGQ